MGKLNINSKIGVPVTPNDLGKILFKNREKDSWEISNRTFARIKEMMANSVEIPREKIVIIPGKPLEDHYVSR